MLITNYSFSLFIKHLVLIFKKETFCCFSVHTSAVFLVLFLFFFNGTDHFITTAGL